MKAQIGNRIEFKGHYGKIGGEVVRKKEVYIVKDEFGIEHVVFESYVTKVREA